MDSIKDKIQGKKERAGRGTRPLRDLEDIAGERIENPSFLSIPKPVEVKAGMEGV